MTSKFTFLMVKNASTYEKLVRIKEFPDLGGDTEMLDATTLSHAAEVFEEGIQKMGGGLEFPAPYSLTDYKKIKALKGQKKSFSVWFGGEGEDADSVVPTGVDGKFNFDGTISVKVVGTGVNSIVDMNLTIAPSTEIVLDETSG